jgi:nucleoredoxin
MKTRFFTIALALVAFAIPSFAALDDVLPETLYNAKGEPVELSTLEGKVIGIYFSAEWCPPCRAFTPTLVDFRNKHKDDFEVVFVSSDRTPADQAKYMEGYKMDFLAVPHRSTAEAANKLRDRYTVKGIPMLVIIDDKGNTLTTNGRQAIASKNADANLKKWKAEAK